MLEDGDMSLKIFRFKQALTLHDIYVCININSTDKPKSIATP